MRRSKGETRRATLVLALLVATAAGWVLLHGPPMRTRSDFPGNAEAAGRSPLPTAHAQAMVGAGSSDRSGDHSAARGASSPPPLASVARDPTDLPGSGALKAGTDDLARRPIYYSRFAGRPGYYPPSDPESLSLVTGRREAPPVDLELSGGASSLRDLALELLAALGANDLSALDGLRVTKHEFRVICWPAFPESRPITNITLDDAWLLAAAKSHVGSTRALGVYGGRDLELLRVETRAPFAYTNFNRDSGVVLVTRDPNTKEEVRLTFAPSVIERHGRYKVLIYRDR